ncbi:MAG: porin [Hyphomicrobium sp.]|jgi:predicted porin
MFGGVGKAGWATILAASGLMLGSSISAQAADLGGDCCADLEERVAELEATTARKGNRKVSLTVYGQVNQAIGWWDDGQETNVYQFTNDTSRTRFGFKGKAKINGDWYAGYRIEIGVRAPDQGALSANTASIPGEFDLRHSYWTLGSKTYGSINVGETSMAHDGIQQFTTARTSHFANQDIFDGNDEFRIVGLGTEWADLAYVFEPGEGSRGSLIRYDSPEFKGFQVKAHYGEDDIWGMALTYEGEIGQFAVAGGIGYGEMTLKDEECTENSSSTVASHCSEYGGSLSVMHKPTGLFATGAYGLRQDDQKGQLYGDDEVTHWMVQAGIEQKWIPLGDTTVFGGFQEHDAGAISTTIKQAQIEFYEVGLNQHISAAAMDLYLHYKHYDADVTTTAGAVSTEPWQTVIGGALIKF